MYEQDEMRQVIMNIRDAARYMDPAYRIFTAAGIVLVQFLARMMKEHKISRSQVENSLCCSHWLPVASAFWLPYL